VRVKVQDNGTVTQDLNMDTMNGMVKQTEKLREQERERERETDR
jgi:hypothetical protein